MQKFGVSVLIHPQSIEDLREDTNIQRREIMLSKVGAYPLLEKPPQPNSDATFSILIGYANDHNTQIDNTILYSLYRDAVDFLITEDRDIRKDLSAPQGVNPVGGQRIDPVARPQGVKNL